MKFSQFVVNDSLLFILKNRSLEFFKIKTIIHQTYLSLFLRYKIGKIGSVINRARMLMINHIFLHSPSYEMQHENESYVSSFLNINLIAHIIHILYMLSVLRSYLVILWSYLSYFIIIEENYLQVIVPEFVLKDSSRFSSKELSRESGFHRITVCKY